MADPTHPAFAHWAEMVEKIREGNNAEADDLYAAVSDEARPQLFRQIDPESVDDRLQEIMVIVFAAIHSGELRDPCRLMGFVRTVTRRRVAAHIRGAIFRRRWLVPVGATDTAALDQSPEERAAARERGEAVRKVLLRLRASDREILTRFYLQEQPQAQVCKEMRLTATQFRLRKSRALSRCLEFASRGRAGLKPPSRSLSRTA